jgi:tetratricopeptide (TPR) repeat protein
MPTRRIATAQRGERESIQQEAHLKYFAGYWLAASMLISAAEARTQSDPKQAAIALERQGRNAEAETAWRAIAVQHANDAEPWAHLGLLEARQEHYDEAIHNYRKALALAPSMPGLRLNLGLSYFKNGTYREAIAMFAPLLTATPDDARLNLLTGMSHYGLGEYAAATPFLRKAAEHDDTNLTLELTLAHSCLLSRQYPCVLDAFHRIVTLNAESAEADMLAGEALDEMHETVAATREFQAAVKANPKEPNGHFGLGYLLWKQGQYAEAAPEFEAELANVPQHAQAMRYLADCYVQTSRLDEAEALLKKVIALDSANAMEHRDLGIVYAEKQRNDDALRELQQAERLAPRDVNVHYRLGRLYRTLGRNAQAKAELEKAATLNKEADQGLLKVMSTAPAGSEKSNADAH